MPKTGAILPWVYDICHPMLRAVRGNRQLIRYLFGLHIPKDLLVQFDPVTLGISRALRKIISQTDQDILEIGIGQGALISLALARGRKLNVVGVDCSHERVTQSRQVAEANGVAVDFFVSDLFSAVATDRRFDLIFFNPPYVPTQVGQRLKMNHRFSPDGDRAWDGGADGSEVLQRFLLEAQRYLSERGRIVFGVQALFVPEDLVQTTISQCGLVVKDRIVHRFPASVCYVVN